MGYRRFIDRDGVTWEVRERSLAEWELQPVGQPGVAPVRVRAPAQEREHDGEGHEDDDQEDEIIDHPPYGTDLLCGQPLHYPPQPLGDGSVEGQDIAHDPVEEDTDQGKEEDRPQADEGEPQERDDEGHLVQVREHDVAQYGDQGEDKHLGEDPSEPHPQLDGCRPPLRRDRTASGSAILRSIDAIAEMDRGVPPIEDVDQFSSTPAAEYAPHIIVLLTDGSSNAGPSPFLAANHAVARGIRVYTIGFGTLNNNSPMDCGPSGFDFDQSGGPFFGVNSFFGGGGGGFRRELDEVTLKQIANMTGGTYYAATSAGELQDVFQNLPTYLVVSRETIEISAARGSPRAPRVQASRRP